MSMLKMFREQSVNLGKAKKMAEEELEDKIVIGVLHKSDKTEFCDEYQKIINDHREKRDYDI